MYSVKLDLSQPMLDVYDLFTPQEIIDILQEVAEALCEPGGILEKHWEEGQSEWREPNERYSDYKNKEYGENRKFVKTGEALKTIKEGSKKYRKIAVKNQRGIAKVEIALVRMEGGKNIYSIAQVGGKGGKGPIMYVSNNKQADKDFVMPYVEAAIERALKRKGLL